MKEETINIHVHHVDIETQALKLSIEYVKY